MYSSESNAAQNLSVRPAVRQWRPALASALALAMTLGLSLVNTDAMAQNTPGQPSVRKGEPVTLNFENADIESVARTIATITGRNVVVDPRVRGTINLVTEYPVSAADAFNQFLVALRMQGYTVVETAGLYKVVPEADAKLQASTVEVARNDEHFRRSGPHGDRIITQIFRINYENAASLVPTLRPLISPNNTINVNPGTNSLIITDYAENLARIAKIIAALDISEASDVDVIPLHYALAEDMVPLLNRLTMPEGPAGGHAAGAAAGAGQGFRTTILADLRSNAVVVRAANAARLAQIRNLVLQLDQPPVPGSSAAQGNIHVVFLKNANATQLAQTLRAAVSAGQIGGTHAAGGSGGSGGVEGMHQISASTQTGGLPRDAGLGSGTSLGEGSGNFGQLQPVSTGGFIQADPTTNSLIITAPEPLYRQLRLVIDKLDGRRAQVMIESLIAEVRADKVAEFGIQWQAGFGHKGDANLAGIGTNFNRGGGANIIDLAMAAASGNPAAIANAAHNIGGGMNFGVAHNYGGRYVLGFLARFLEQTGDANVLSTPNILTLDNEPAHIMIGQNVPFITGQYSNISGGTAHPVTPFQTIEREDVGISLWVKPQINEDGTVRLSVVQEVSDVLNNSAQGPTTSKRLIETNVLVQDGGIVVLGGLLQDRYTQGQDKVPLLGDIPLIGNAFRSEQRQREKVNLMVFLRPIVLYDGTSTDAMAMMRYDQIRREQIGMQPAAHIGLNSVSAAPVLPVLPPSSGPLGQPVVSPDAQAEMRRRQQSGSDSQSPFSPPVLSGGTYQRRHLHPPAPLVRYMRASGPDARVVN